ncbi:Na/Pi cotransporter family protein [Blastopirellula sp. JC732]|uniref:Na/Pi cotransporter family protein n=1 Tax=Blastopirellula sediminis TaxID=2894196 RepID=A0A9X1MJB5_9BACT|nr:Na/Pi cotransporter family protein [Blastopirellula sediminis]MCC9609422.1 Na/Pi cotransporter family protein [Blastopirellula sediminis]MCC9627801.1 Na/Pi cotransporter family protein [Blastopirellula sediminis]
MLFAATTINALEISIGLLGGLALFLYGMHQMSDGLKAVAGDGLKVLLGRLTTNRFTAVFTGAAVTAVIQSSSVTTVLVVGFVSAGLMTLQQSIGVIMGSNIGTTVTAQIIAFQVTKYAWLMVAVGFGSWSFSRSAVLRNYGAMLLGLGMLFLGMDQMSSATYPLRSFEPFIDLMGRMDNPALAILLGAAFTAVIQSSSAATGIVIMLASQGVLSLDAGIALAIGANIGTCVTAILSSIGKPVDARRAAVVHVMFNVLGALLWVFLIGYLAEMSRWISPEFPNLEGTQRLAAETPRQIANANTLFNVANTLILIWFTGPIAKLATRIVPEPPIEEVKRIEPMYLDPEFLQTPALALDRVRLELTHMGELIVEMLQSAPTAVLYGDKGDLRALKHLDDDVDILHVAILDYLRQIQRAELTPDHASQIQTLILVANYLENSGDLIETNLVTQGKRRIKRKVSLPPAVVQEPLEKIVLESMQAAVQAIRPDDQKVPIEIESRQALVDQLAEEATEKLALQLVEGGEEAIQPFRIQTDLINVLKRLFHNAKRILELCQ